MEVEYQRMNFLVFKFFPLTDNCLLLFFYIITCLNVINKMINSGMVCVIQNYFKKKKLMQIA